MTYLELVNEVLRRLRENTVTTVNQTAYSRLISYYINDAKRQVENAWNWDVLGTGVQITTVPGTTVYTLTGAGTLLKDVSANITTSGNQAPLRFAPRRWVEDQQQLTTITPNSPMYYTWVGDDGTDKKVEIYPTPNGAYTIIFNMTVPQVGLVSDADELLVPSEPVIAGALARAMVERGEDGGLPSSEAYGLFKNILADYIALEASRDSSYECWTAA